MSTEAILQVLIALAGTGAIGSVVVGIFSRKKTKAESEKISAEAAQLVQSSLSGLVKEYREENEGLRTRLDNLDRDFQELRGRFDDTNRNLRIVTNGFVEAVSTLRDLNVDITRLVSYVERHTGSRMDLLHTGPITRPVPPSISNDTPPRSEGTD